MNSPPRYVPTLTEVVLPRPSQEGADDVVKEAILAAEPHGQADALHPAFVPPEAEQSKPAPPAEPVPSLAEQRSLVDIPKLQEQLIERVLMRLNESLDQRIQDAVAQVLLARTEELALVLHEAIDGAVRRTVKDALAYELSSIPLAGPGQSHQD